VEEILTSRLHYGKLQYQVDWRGWDPDQTWYPASNFKGAPKKLREYHEAYPAQAGPPVRLEAWEAAYEAGTEAPAHEKDEDAIEAVEASKDQRYGLRRRR
jgi:''chromo'' (CHRromatin Organisation MOdifier) domain.